MTIYLTDDAFSVKAKRFDKMFTSILALLFLLRIANKSHFYAPVKNVFEGNGLNCDNSVVITTDALTMLVSPSGF